MASADEKSFDDINVTPMVDLYLVLLLIFIIMTTAGVQGVKVKLPSANSKPATQKLDAPKTQAITIDPSGNIKLNATPSSLADLESKLGALVATTPDIPVVVRGDRSNQYQLIMDVLDVLGRVGVNQIALATQPGQVVPNPTAFMSDQPPKKRKRKETNPLPWVLLVVALIVGGIWQASRGSKGSHKVTKADDTMTVTLPPLAPPSPPPPPPPPPPSEPPPPDDKMVEQEPVPEDEPPPDNSAPEPPSDLDLGPGSANGSGPSIGGGGGGNHIGGNGRRGSGSKYGWYAAKVQSSIREALGRNPSTRSATMSLQVKVWADANGRITRAQLVGTSGNPAVDQSIKNQVLTGLQLPQAPPADMPMPINLRITARKPTT